MKTEIEYCEDLAQRVSYEDGSLYWVKTNQKRYIGRVVGKRDRNGYMVLHTTNKKMIFCHRLIYFKFHGYLPKYIDHIDGDPTNNRIENLRAVSLCQNAQNAKLPSNNTTGVKGVCFDPKSMRWTAVINANRQSMHLGTFNNIFDAACARRSAEVSLFGEFAR